MYNYSDWLYMPLVYRKVESVLCILLFIASSINSTSIQVEVIVV
jgi:hypothetical protein